MVILGIDPGIAATGFGSIRCDRSTPFLITCGAIRTSPRDHVSRRLLQIRTDLDSLISSLRPDLVAVENAFSLVRYPRAGILLGGVLGIIYVSVCSHGLSIMELSPREVKNALVGYGAAGKSQIRSAIKHLLRIDDRTSNHASDALAVALTAFYRNGGRRTP